MVQAERLSNGRMPETLRIAAQWVVLMLWLLAPLPTSAQAAFEWDVTPAFAGNYVPGRWYPLHVSLANSGPAFEARIVAMLPGSAEQYVQDISMPQGSQKDTVLYVPMSQTTRLIEVVVIRQDMDASTSAEPPGRQQIMVRPRVGERLLGSVSSQVVELALPTRQMLERLPFVTFDIPIQRFPERVEGLGSVTVLLLHDMPVAGFTAAQQRALVGWVHQGGHLVVGGGAINSPTIAALPAELRLAAPGSPVALDPAVLGALMGDAGPEALPGMVLRAHAEADAARRTSSPLWIQRSVGQGLVTQLAFDPTTRALRAWDAAPQFWDWLLQPTQPMIAEPDAVQATAIEQALTRAVSWLPPTLLPAATPLFVLLLGYVVIVAPGMALLLRRADKQVWFWLLVPSTALICAGLAFWVARELQTDQRIVSQVSLVEQVTDDHARVRTALALLAPQTTTAAIQVSPDAFVRPLPTLGTSGSDVMGFSGEIVQFTRRLAFTAERWQVQGLIAEQQLAFAAPVAQIMVTDDGIHARVQNATAQPLRNAVIVFGSGGVALGDIAPGQETIAQWPVQAIRHSEPAIAPLVHSALVYGSTTPPAPGDPATLSSANRARNALVGAALPQHSAAHPTPLLLGWLDTSPLMLDLDRQGAASRHTVLLAATPEITGSGRLDIPPDWLHMQVAGSPDSGLCITDGRSGLALQTAPLTVTLRPPLGLVDTQITELALDMGPQQIVASEMLTTTVADGAVSIELFDWQRARWVDVAAIGTPATPGTATRLVVPDAVPYVQRGTVALRLQAQRTGCAPFAAHLTGVLP
jgi:hypothetical protein